MPSKYGSLESKSVVVQSLEERAFQTLDPGVYFRDGRRKIDYVLVYETKDYSYEKESNKRRRAAREKFFANLKEKKIELEEEIEHYEDQHSITYVKVHVPFEVLCLYAEDLNMRAPLQLANEDCGLHGVTKSEIDYGQEADSLEWSSEIWSKIMCCIPNPMVITPPNRPPEYFACPFKKEKLSKYFGSDNPDTFFAVRHRIKIAKEILSNTYYGVKTKAEIGVDRMVEEKYLSAAFCPHDGDYIAPESYTSEDCLNSRQILYKFWADWSMWYKYQPLDYVREYFGEKIAIYFAWLGFYTAWLLPAAVVGVIVFVMSVVAMFENPLAEQVCNANGIYMCPACPECSRWELKDNCYNTWIAYLFDNGYTIFYAAFISFWSVLFLEYWKRTSAVLAHRWDVFDFAPLEENPRPQYAALSKEMRKNPITAQLEPYFSEQIRLARMMSGVSVLFLMITVVIIFVISVVVYRSFMITALYQVHLFENQASIIASGSGACIQVILIMAAGQVYTKVAEKFNDWEMHRTQEEYDNNLTFKVFVFQFVNFYSSIIYIAFFKGKIVGYPGHYQTVFNYRLEDCPNGDCLMEMATQLAIIMIGKQIVNNTVEVGLPIVKKYYNKFTKDRHKARSTSAENLKFKRLEADYILPENTGLFEEYLEMVLQFGFITIFVCAFPLAPLFALLNNWLEIRVDANKYVCQVRRAVAERANNIGIWYEILAAISRLAVLSNAFLIAFTSDFLNRMFYKYSGDGTLEGYVNFTLSVYHPGEPDMCRYKGFRDPEGHLTKDFWNLFAVKLIFMIIFEHFVFMVGVLIDVIVPDIPQQLDLKIKRERYLARQALSQVSDTIS